MKHAIFKTGFAILVGCLMIAVHGAQAQPLTLDFANVANADIAFSGASTFAFVTGSGGEDFNITNDPGGNGSSIGLTGLIGGTFTIGTITTVGSVSTAPVTGAGSLSISGLTATLDWVDITQVGTGGTLNDNGVLDLTNISYAGSNADLKQLAENTKGTATLTFQFIPAVSLSTLKSTAESTSYSGSLVNQVPDGGMTICLLGMALAGVEGVRRSKLLRF